MQKGKTWQRVASGHQKGTALSSKTIGTVLFFEKISNENTSKSGDDITFC